MGQYHIKRNHFSLGRYSSFVAVQKDLEREVLFNQVSLYYADAADKLEWCQQEVKKWSCLSHPNLVEFVDMWREETMLVFITTYPGGKSLEAFLGPAEEMEEEYAVWLGKEIAALLAFLHTKGLWHGGLQLGGFQLVTQRGLKMTQSGIPFAVNRFFEEGLKQLGPQETASFFQRTDIVSWGNLMSTLLSGRRELRRQNGNEEAPGDLPELKEKFSGSLERIVQRALLSQLEPHQGYASFYDVIEELNRLSSNG